MKGAHRANPAAIITAAEESHNKHDDHEGDGDITKKGPDGATDNYQGYEGYHYPLQVFTGLLSSHWCRVFSEECELQLRAESKYVTKYYNSNCLNLIKCKNRCGRMDKKRKIF